MHFQISKIFESKLTISFHRKKKQKYCNNLNLDQLIFTSNCEEEDTINKGMLNFPINISSNKREKYWTCYGGRNGVYVQ